MEQEVQCGCHGFYPYSLVSQEDTEMFQNLFFSVLSAYGLEVTPGGQSIKSIFCCTDISVHI